MEKKKMVGEEEVTFNSEYNDLPESKGENEVLTPNGYFGDGPHLELAYENDRRALHHARNRIDADSPDGHTYSNILELRKNWELCRPGDFAEQNLPRLMLVQERRLAVKVA